MTGLQWQQLARGLQISGFRPEDIAGMIGPNPYSTAIRDVQQQYPLLRNVPFAVTDAPNKPYYSETYMPWDDENPVPGKLNIELRKQSGLTGQPLEDALATESFHLLGATQPSGVPYNQDWYTLKQQLAQTLSPRELAVAQAQAQQNQRPLSAEMQRSFLDMLIRGYLSPQSQGDEWIRRKASPTGWTPQQQVILEQLKGLLTNG